MSSLMAVGWEYILGAIGIIGAIALTWFTAKSKGQTEAKAEADVNSANAEKEAAQNITTKQEVTIKAVKDVAQANQSLSDSSARERMRTSKYHTAD